MVKIRYRNILLAEESEEWRRNHPDAAAGGTGGAGGGGSDNSGGGERFYAGNFDYSFMAPTPEDEERVLSGGGGETPEGVEAARQKAYLDSHPNIVRKTAIINRGGKSYVVSQDFIKTFSWNCPHPGWRYTPVGGARILGVYGVTRGEAEDIAAKQSLAWSVREEARRRGESLEVAGYRKAGELLGKKYGDAWRALWGTRQGAAQAYRAQRMFGLFLAHMAEDKNAAFDGYRAALNKWEREADETMEEYRRERDKALLHAFNQYEAETEDRLRENGYWLWLRNPAEYAMWKQGYRPPEGFLYGFASAFGSDMTLGLSEFLAPRSRLPNYLLYAVVGERPAGYNPHNPMPRPVAERYLRYAYRYFDDHPGAMWELLGELGGDIAAGVVGPRLVEKLGEAAAPRLSRLFGWLGERGGGLGDRLLAAGQRLVEEGESALGASGESRTFIGSGALTGRLKVFAGRAAEEAGALVKLAGGGLDWLGGKLEPREWRVRRLRAVRVESGEPVGGTRITPVVEEEVVSERPDASRLVRLEDVVGYQGRGFLYDTEPVSRMRYRLYRARAALRGLLGLGDDYFGKFEVRQLYGGGPARLNVEAYGVPGQAEGRFTGVVSEPGGVWYRGRPVARYRSPLYIAGEIGEGHPVRIFNPSISEEEVGFRVRYTPGIPRGPKAALDKIIDATMDEVWRNPLGFDVDARIEEMWKGWLNHDYLKPTVYEKLVGVKVPASWLYPVEGDVETLRSVKTETLLGKIHLKPRFGIYRGKLSYTTKTWDIDLGLWPRAAAERLAGAAAEADEAISGGRILGLYLDVDSVFTLPKEEGRGAPRILGGGRRVEVPGAPGGGGGEPVFTPVKAAGAEEAGAAKPTEAVPRPGGGSSGGEARAAGFKVEGGEAGSGAKGTVEAAGNISLVVEPRAGGAAPVGLRVVESPLLGFKPVYPTISGGEAGLLLTVGRVAQGVRAGQWQPMGSKPVWRPLLGFKPRPDVKAPSFTVPGLFGVSRPVLASKPNTRTGVAPVQARAVKPVEKPQAYLESVVAPSLDITPIQVVPPWFPPPPPPPPPPPKRRVKKPKGGKPLLGFRLRPLRLGGGSGEPYDVIRITRPREFIKIF